MAAFIGLMETILTYVVEICTIALEMAGIIVLVSTACKCFARWLNRDRKHVRLDLAQGIALALEFKMGGEVLRTVVVREWSELGILGAIIVLRAAMTFLIHWEIENEKKELKQAAESGIGTRVRRKGSAKPVKRADEKGIEAGSDLTAANTEV